MQNSPETGKHAPGRWERSLVPLLAAGVAARLVLLWWFHGEPLQVGDEQHYNAIAVNLVRFGEFSFDAGSPTSLRPPLYPALLAAVYSVCGTENYQAVRWIQSLLGMVLVVLVYFLARDMFSQRVASVAAAICCFYPSLLVFNDLLLTEIPFAVLVCGTCLALQRHLRRGTIGPLILTGLLLGLAALVRSVLWLFPPLLFAFLLFATRDAGWLRRVALALVPVLAFGLTILPWAVRNTRLQKTFTAIDDMGGRNFMMGNYEYTPLYRAWDAIGAQGEQAWYRVLAKKYPLDGHERTQGEIDKLALRYGLQFVAEHPLLTLQRDLVKFFTFWQLERELVAGAARGKWGNLPKPAVFVLAAVITASYVLVMLSGILGFAAAEPSDRRMHWFLLLLVAFICAMHTAVFGHSRYHLPIMPLVFIYSSFALLNLGQVWERRRRRALWMAAGFATLLVAGWIWEALAAALPQLVGSAGVSI